MNKLICGLLLFVLISTCHTIELNNEICFRANEKICFSSLENICLLKIATINLQNANHRCVLNGFIEKVRVCTIISLVPIFESRLIFFIWSALLFKALWKKICMQIADAECYTVLGSSMLNISHKANKNVGEK